MSQMVMELSRLSSLCTATNGNIQYVTDADGIALHVRLSYLYCDKKWLSPVEKATMVSEDTEYLSIILFCLGPFVS